MNGNGAQLDKANAPAREIGLSPLSGVKQGEENFSLFSITKFNHYET